MLDSPELAVFDRVTTSEVLPEGLAAFRGCVPGFRVHKSDTFNLGAVRILSREIFPDPTGAFAAGPAFQPRFVDSPD